MANQSLKAKKRQAMKRISKAAHPQYRTVKYFTRGELIECALLGPLWEYNRQVSERVAELPEGNYPVVFETIHHQRHGEPCEAHVRCQVSGPNGVCAVLDVPMWYYGKLSKRRVTARWKAA